jgi:hypothetical protein
MIIRHAPLFVIALPMLLAALALAGTPPAVLPFTLMGAAGVVLMLAAMRSDDRPASRAEDRWSRAERFPNDVA